MKQTSQLIKKLPKGTALSAVKGTALLALISLVGCRPTAPTLPPATPPSTPTEPPPVEPPPTPTDPDSQASVSPVSSANADNLESLERSENSVLSAEPESCDPLPVTQMEMNQCAGDTYTQANYALSQAHEALKGELSDSGQQALDSVELAWTSFRDLDCTFARNKYAGGSISPLIYHDCRTRLTNERIAELEEPQIPQVSYAAADAQLNQTYQDVLAVITPNRNDDLVSAQLAWLEYRDRNCAFEVLYSSNVIEESQCLARMSTVRTAQLQDTLEQNSL